ncbi:MAG TPA: type II toxin-antitoxin system prevent-host-death family antitoxin [Blastocatellia bacterium]|nr:type II toxin-antitoxin system prevent-host-death family antitoxin [Blastocatellia bacterium]
MQTVNIADLKNNLSAYLEKVRRGEELIVKDRNQPIARVLPLRAEEDYELEEEALVAAGLLRLPTAELPKDFWKTPAPNVPIEKLRAAIRADRDED